MRFQSKKAFLTVPLMVLVCVAALNASPSLKLSGTVVDVNVGCEDDRPHVVVQLLMQFHNTGDEPVIYFEPPRYFETRVNFIDGTAGLTSKGVNGEVVQAKRFWVNSRGEQVPIIEPTPSWISFLRSVPRFRNSRPFSNFVILEPGRYIEFSTSVPVRNGFRFTGIAKNEDKKCNAEMLTVAPEYASIQIEYFFSSKKYKFGEGIFRELKDAWKDYGDLIIHGDSEILYRSDRILIPK